MIMGIKLMGSNTRKMYSYQLSAASYVSLSITGLFGGRDNFCLVVCQSIRQMQKDYAKGFEF